ncbi:MAG: polyprenyl synthetase family protein [Actinomycetota bacterium]
MRVDELASLLHMPQLDEQLRSVERRLDDTMGTDAAYLTGPARRVVRGGGKRLRPALVLASALAAGGDVSPDVIAGAAALELVHVGSLVHDDIIDRADERRGVPTISAVEGVNHAILVGDFLLARAGELAASVSKDVARALATAIVDLCRGQSLETAVAFDHTRTLEQYTAAIDGKTAALLSCSCRVGALAAGGDPDQVKALAVFGRSFGMAFQIVDDVLDLASSSTAMGKPVGNDIREGVYTLPLLLVLERSENSSLRAELRPALDDAALARIVAAILQGGGVEGALGSAAEFNGNAVAALANLPDSPTRRGLEALPKAYLDWALREKTDGTLAIGAG